MQPMFRKFHLFSYLGLILLFLAILAFDDWLKSVEVRSDGPARQANVRFSPVPFEPSGFAPLRLAGVWRVDVDDPRFGGVSALAIDGKELIALTDSGTVIRLPRPGHGSMASLRDLPAGPGIAQLKVNRDSEALARDPAGRGWWVAFEQWHQLWLYDAGFRRALRKIDLGRNRWPDNRGIEAMAAEGSGLVLFPEPGGEWLRLGDGHLRSHRLANAFGNLSDAARLPDGRLLLVTRQFGPTGIAKHLVLARPTAQGLVLRDVAALGLGATDNVEGIAAEPRDDGGTRLWVVTDNDFRPRKATLLLALDLP